MGCGLSRLLCRHLGAQATEEAWSHIRAITLHDGREGADSEPQDVSVALRGGGQPH